MQRGHLDTELLPLSVQGQLSQELDHYIDGINVTTLSAVSVVNQYKESDKAVRDGNIDVLTIDAEVFSVSVYLYDFHVM